MSRKSRLSRGAAGFGLAFATLCAAAAFAPAAHANLVANGSFETGDFTGWIQGGNTGFTGVECGGGFVGNAQDGDCDAYFGPVGSDGFIEQVLATVPGQSYVVQFALQNLSGGTTNDFLARFDSVTLLSLFNAPSFPYTVFTYLVPASAMSTVLRFTLRHDPSYYTLDAISVTAAAVPEPGTLALLGAGLAGLGVVARRRRRGEASPAA